MGGGDGLVGGSGGEGGGHGEGGGGGGGKGTGGRGEGGGGGDFRAIGEQILMLQGPESCCSTGKQVLLLQGVGRGTGSRSKVSIGMKRCKSICRHAPRNRRRMYFVCAKVAFSRSLNPVELQRCVTTRSPSEYATNCCVSIV